MGAARRHYWVEPRVEILDGKVVRTWTEMLDGKIVMMARPSISHITVQGNIEDILRHFLKGKKCRKCKVFEEPDVFFAEKVRVSPDIVVVCNLDIVKKNGIHGAPDIIVEILSPGTEKRDRNYKMNLYAKHGVKEYWIVNTDSYTVEVYLPDGSGRFRMDDIYRLAEEETEYDKMCNATCPPDLEAEKFYSEFSPSMFPELTIHMEDIFDDTYDFEPRKR